MCCKSVNQLSKNCVRISCFNLLTSWCNSSEISDLEPVHMGRSYLDSRDNISTGQIILFCSYGEMFSRLLGKVSRCDVDFVTCKQKVFPLSGKVVFIWDKNYLGHRDLACQQARSRYPGKRFVPYERNATFHIIS